MLPEHLPTSFESKHGFIRYQIKVEVESPQIEDRFQFYFDFTVNQSIDLNSECPGLRKKLKISTSKSFFLGLSSKALIMSAEIPRSAFVPGQTVTVSIDYLNDSSVAVEETEVFLKKIIHYLSKTPSKRIKEKIESKSEARCEGVQCNSQLVTYKVSFPIPSVPPTSINSCEVIEVYYEIHVLAKVSGIHRNPIIRLPIAIGTIPFNNDNSPSSGSAFFSIDIN